MPRPADFRTASTIHATGGATTRPLATFLALAAFSALVMCGLCGCFARSPTSSGVDTVRSPSLTDPNPNTSTSAESPYYLRHDPF